MALLRDLSIAEDAKIGVSTRPYIAFQTGFHSYPSLMLQNLTYGDARTYVVSKFNDNPAKAELRIWEPEIKNITLDMVEKAAGAFL